MSVYYCPRCNKKYFIDCEINEAVENSFKCEFCGYSKVSTKTCNDVSAETNNNETSNNELLKLEYRKVNLLQDIRNMMKLFYVTSIIGIIGIVVFIIECFLELLLDLI